MAFGPAPLPIEVRFWAKVDRRGPDECWPWLGGTMRGGYGQILAEPGGRRTMIRTHRLSYELHHGPIPEFGPDGHRVLVRHRCDNPPCVNPGHLELGSPLDNMRDMRERGRGRQGEYLRRREYCKHGHEYTPANTKMRTRQRSSGHVSTARVCRTCVLNESRKRRSQSG